MSAPGISPIRIGRRIARQVVNFPGGLRRSYYGPITHVRTNSNLIALTFDDGPHPVFTPELLRILGAFGAKATFFMVGQQVEGHSDLVRQIAEAGHAIGNHSFSHPEFPKLSSGARQKELQRCEAVLAPHMSKLFRPPFGLENIFTHRDAHRQGYQVIKWNLSPDDWRPHPAEWIADRFLEGAAPGSIALMHDNVIDDPKTNRVQTLQAVEQILHRLCGRYQFCTVPQLLAAGVPMTSFQPI